MTGRANDLFANPQLQVPGLTYAFSVRLEFGSAARLRFRPAFKDYTRGFVSVLDGEIGGPRLSGRVIPQSGGDWPQLRESGLVNFEAHYLLEATDGTPIYVHNRGLAFSSPDDLAALESGATSSDVTTYCRITPSFEVPAGPHEWLARTLFVGIAERRGSHSLFEYYAVT